jgi:hypothetical protein
MTTTLIDDITGAFLAASLGDRTCPHCWLSCRCATIAYYKEYAMVMMYGTGLGMPRGSWWYVMGAMGYMV